MNYINLSYQLSLFKSQYSIVNNDEGLALSA